MSARNGRAERAAQQVGEQLPPHNLEAEEAVLGALLLDRDAIGLVAETLLPADFYRGSHGAIYGAILDLFKRRVPADLLTVAGELERRGALDTIGGYATLTALVQATPTAVHVAYYAALVARTSQLRRVIQSAAALVNDAYRPDADPAEVARAGQESLARVARSRAGRDFVTVGEVLGGLADDLARRATPGGGRPGLTTGFADLDALTGGWQPDTLVVVAGRPGQGKSALALAFARHATVTGSPVAFYSLEMGATELTMRLVASEAAVPFERLRAGALDQSEWLRATHAQLALAPLPLHLCDSAPLDVPGIRSRLLRLRERVPVGLVVVDYLQLVTGKGDNRQTEVASISRGLKLLAKETGLPVIALAQLSREVEKRPSKLPQLSDLRESGGIENDADLVCLLYRDEEYDPDSARRGLLELHIRKHRNGRTGVVTLRADFGIGRFLDTVLVSEQER